MIGIQNSYFNIDDISIISDFSAQGLIRSLHTYIKMHITSFSNSNERQQFYEQQSNQIFQAVGQKLTKQSEQIQKNKQTLDLLRLENHDIYERLRQIKILLLQLNEELKGNRDSKQSRVSGPRTNQIDTYMQVFNKKKEIEDDIQTLKLSNEGFQKKMNYNQQEIVKLEQEIQTLIKQQKSINKSLVQFLVELLKLGLDNRNSGLIWIIQKLWSMNEKINESNFPIFLDSKAREFLIKVNKSKQIIYEQKTQKLWKLDNLVKQSHENFINYKQKLQNNLAEKSGSSFHQDQGLFQSQNNSSIMQVSAFQNSFAMIDSSQLKQVGAIENKQRKENQLNDLMYGLTEPEKRFIDFSITMLNTTKETSNDLIYNEAQKKITSIVTKKQNNEQIQQNQRIQSPVSNDEVQQLRETLIKEYGEIQSLIEKKRKKLQQFEDDELNRIIKEIDFKNYLNRYRITDILFRFNVEAIQLLSALFGYSKAEREIIKNGILKK